MPKKTLRRFTLEQVQAAWESGKLNLMNANKPSPRSFGLVNAKNNTLATIPVGGHVKITGFARNLTYSQARRLMLQNGFLFNAVVSTAADDANAVGTAEETIRSTNIGKVRIDNLTFGAVVINNASHTLVDAAFNSVEENGVYKIIAKSETSNGSAICALVKLSGGESGGSSDKIMYGTIASLITSSGTPRYNITGSDGNNYDVALTVYPSTLLVIGRKAVFCVPSDGSQAWLLNTESV